MSLYSNTRCVDGRVMRHDPQHDDPDLETDIGMCEECEGAGCATCEDCGAHTTNPEDEYGEHVCDDCAQNAAEAAWERQADGGAAWPSLAQQQADARRLK